MIIPGSLSVENIVRRIVVEACGGLDVVEVEKMTNNKVFEEFWITKQL